MPGISLTINNTLLEDNAWETVCMEMLEFLVSITPVDTGFCQDSWSIDLTLEDCVFTNDCEYASYLDEGWSDQAPDGMIGPALQKLPELVKGY